MVKRLSKFPIAIEHLNLDVICISHGHYDHLDMVSLQALEIYSKKTKIIMPSKLSSYLKQGADVTEVAWYEETTHCSIRFSFSLA